MKLLENNYDGTLLIYILLQFYYLRVLISAVLIFILLFIKLFDFTVLFVVNSTMMYIILLAYRFRDKIILYSNNVNCCTILTRLLL